MGEQREWCEIAKKVGSPFIQWWQAKRLGRLVAINSDADGHTAMGDATLRCTDWGNCTAR
jgi:hypothetical protein